MLEWNPRLVALVVGSRPSIALFSGWIVIAVNFGWGAGKQLSSIWGVGDER